MAQGGVSPFNRRVNPTFTSFTKFVSEEALPLDGVPALRDLPAAVAQGELDFPCNGVIGFPGLQQSPIPRASLLLYASNYDQFQNHREPTEVHWSHGDHRDPDPDLPVEFSSTSDPPDPDLDWIVQIVKKTFSIYSDRKWRHRKSCRKGVELDLIRLRLYL